MKRNNTPKELCDKLEAEKNVLEDQYTSECNLLRRKIEVARARRSFVTFEVSNDLKSIIEAIVEVVPDLTSRERHVVSRIISGVQVSRLADDIGLPTSEARSIVQHACTAIKSIRGLFDYVVQENRRLYKRCDDQHNHIQKMKLQISDMRKLLNPATKGISIDDYCSHISIESMNMSGRPTMRLIRYGVINLFDLLSLTESDLNNFSGLGKTSISEIKQTVDRISTQKGLDLYFGMFKNNNTK